MKALHVVPAVADRYGGPSRAAIEMCRALRRRGLDVLVAATDADGPGRLPVRLGETQPYGGVPAVFLPRQWSEAFKYSRPLAAWLRAHVAGFDVVHVHGVFSHACLAAARACRIRRVPYVVRPLGTLDPWSLGRKPLRKRLLWHAGAARMLREAAAVHYTTAAERRLAESGLGLGRGVVIPLGVDEALLAPGDAPGAFRARQPALGGDPYVLALCRLDPKKGLELLVDTFLDLPAAVGQPAWRLVIAGDGEPRYVAGLRDLAARRDPHGRVVFTGWLSGSDRVEALRGAGLLASPSRQENFGLSVAEAMACGTPVLVSEQVNLADEIRSGGAGWVTALDPAALRDALGAALADGPGRAARGAAARRLARARFAWPAVADALAELYVAVAVPAARRSA